MTIETERLIEAKNGLQCRAILEARKDPGPNGESRVLRVFLSKDAGGSWVQLSLRLRCFEKLRAGFFSSWPPATLDDFEYCDGRLRLVFHDEWIPFERPLLPFRLDEESRWEATLNDGEAAWRLRRLGFMNYDTTSNEGGA